MGTCPLLSEVVAAIPPSSHTPSPELAAGRRELAGSANCSPWRPPGGRQREQLAGRDAQRALTMARSDWRSDCVVATTADGSYPQWAMQLLHRGSLPRP